MVVKVGTDSADVKYIMGGRTEKEICKQRIVSIPMPYRGAKATTRSTSSTHQPKASAANIEAVQNHHPFRSMTNALQRLKFGLQTTSNNPSRRHEKEGWMRIELQKAGMWDGDKKHIQQLVMADYQSQLAAVEYGKDIMGKGHEPRSYVEKKKKEAVGNLRH